MTFRQTYRGVDGDSASLAELVAILSDPAEVAVGQDLETTRSVNQYAFAPAIGGGQHKFECFFRTCRVDGTRDGSQGAAVPVANENHLVLTGEVADGNYAVYCIETIKDALELFTGVPAGTGGAKGEFGNDAVFGKSRH